MLRTLLDRYVEIDRQLAATVTHAQQLERRLLANEHAHDRTTKSIAEARWRLERNAQIVAELDRPLRRRNNRREIERATQLLANEPLAIASHQQRLQELDAQQQGIEADARLAERAALKRPMISAEQRQIGRPIHDDRHTRGRLLSYNPPAITVDNLGEPPTDPVAIQRWERAAGAIHQHQAAHDVTDAHRLLGHEPQPWATDTYAFTYRQAADAVNDLQAIHDHALGPREPSLAADIGLDL